MMKYAFAAASMATAAMAASSSCSTDGTTTIQAPTALAGCSTYSGSVAVATGAAGSFNIAGVKEITGSLEVSNAPNVTQLSADSLAKIGGNFTLDNNSGLQTITFASLNETGAIDWSGLAVLNSVTLGSDGLSKAPEISIQNTGLSSLNTIFPPIMDSIIIANNPGLQTLSFEIGNISDYLSIASNGDRLVVSFPNLEWANNFTIRDAVNVSIPSLKEIKGSFGLYENSFTSIKGANLTSVAGTFALVQNDQLTNASFPNLSSVGGGFQIANNTELYNITGFPALETVGGAFDVYGNFSRLEVPALKEVDGAFNVQSSSDITGVCDDFSSRNKDDSDFVGGTYVCAGKLVTPAGEGTKPGKTNDGTDAGAASSLSISFGALSVAAFAALFL